METRDVARILSLGGLKPITGVGGQSPQTPVIGLSPPKLKILATSLVSISEKFEQVFAFRSSFP